MASKTDPADVRFATQALLLMCEGTLPDLTTPERFGRYTALICDEMATAFAAFAPTYDPDRTGAEMRRLWEAVRDDPSLAQLRAAVEAAEARAKAHGNGHAKQTTTPEPECPPLPAHPDEDPDLIARLAAEASPWLDGYVTWSRQWAPRAYDDFHEACGLFVLSGVSARRVHIEFGGHGTYTSLYQALTARTSLWTKTTVAALALGLINEVGLTHLLAPDDATPQAFLRGLVARVPETYEDLTVEQREGLLRRLAFAAQRAWFYEEFGQHLSAMMQRDGPMAAFRGILRRFDDHRDRLSHDTIGRGLDEIVKPYLSLLANITPADLKPYARARSPLWGDGYFARFAFVVAPLTDYGNARYPKGRLTYPPTLVTDLKRWHDRLGVPEVSIVPVLDQKSKPTGRYRLAGGELRATTYTLSDHVWEAYYRYDAAMRQLIGQAETQDLDGSYARFPIKALHVAGLLASLEGHPSRTIEWRHWYRGRQIAERWRASLHQLVTQLADDLPGESREQQVEQRIERALRRHGAQSIRELHLKSDLSYAELNKAVETLMAVGAVEVDQEKSQRTTKYRLVPYSSNGHEP